jgi:hypothetical protein
MKIITHPQSRAYDEGWDAIFGKKAEEDHVHELGSCSFCDRREPPAPAGHHAMPGRKPRGWTPKSGG